MSALTELAEYLAKLAGDKSGQFLDKVGGTMLEGAAQPGTYTQGRAFAKTPEALATQFGLGTPEAYPNGGLRFPVATDAEQYSDVTPYSRARLTGMQLNDSSGMEYPGIHPFLDDPSIPQSANFNMATTDRLNRNSGNGTAAYPALYGHVLNDPDGHMITGALTGPNVFRRNYSLASAIGRDPTAGSRLLASPDQFAQLPVDVSALRAATPERQMGTLQVEGALQALQRMFKASTMERNPVRRGALLDLPGQLGSAASPYSLESAARVVNGGALSATGSIGPRVLGKLGIIKDLAEGRPVNFGAFRGLDYCEGGSVANAGS